MKTTLFSTTLGLAYFVAQSALAQTAATPATPDVPPAAGDSTTPASEESATEEAPPAEAAPAEAAPTDGAPAEADAPSSVEPTAVETIAAGAAVVVEPTTYLSRFKPEGNLWELGVLGGLLFPDAPFDTAGEFGVRAAYFPLSFLGGEFEAAAGPSTLQGTGAASNSAGLWAIRGHLVAQWPDWSIAPFVLIGAGGRGSTAGVDAAGNPNNSIDPALHFGGGVKVPVDHHLSIRFDVRDTVSFDSSGASHHTPGILLGLTFVPKRHRPNADGDGRLDYEDQCPTIPGEASDGCVPPPPEPECPCPPADAATE